MPAAREEQITVVEGLIGLHFPDDHRRLLLEQDSWSTAYGDTVIQYLGIEQIREQFMRGLRDGPPGLVDFVAFGSDVDRRRIGYDRRVNPSPVVMLEVGAVDWSSAMLQGVGFVEFIARLQEGKNLDFGTSYAGPPA